MSLWQETGHASQADRNAEAQQLVDGISQHYEEMQPNERRFVEQMDEALDRFGENAVISAKQLFWLRDLNVKY